MPCRVITAKYTSKPVTERNHCAVENTVGLGSRIPRDYRIFGVTPENIPAPESIRTILPGDVWQRCEIDEFSFFERVHKITIGARCTAVKPENLSTILIAVQKKSGAKAPGGALAPHV